MAVLFADTRLSQHRSPSVILKPGRIRHGQIARGGLTLPFKPSTQITAQPPKNQPKHCPQDDVKRYPVPGIATREVEAGEHQDTELCWARVLFVGLYKVLRTHAFKKTDGQIALEINVIGDPRVHTLAGNRSAFLQRLIGRLALKALL